MSHLFSNTFFSQSVLSQALLWRGKKTTCSLGTKPFEPLFLLSVQTGLTWWISTAVTCSSSVKRKEKWPSRASVHDEFISTLPVVGQVNLNFPTLPLCQGGFKGENFNFPTIILPLCSLQGARKETVSFYGFLDFFSNDVLRQCKKDIRVFFFSLGLGSWKSRNSLFISLLKELRTAWFGSKPWPWFRRLSCPAM